MDITEKKVLRRKTPLLIKSLSFDNTFRDAVRAQRLLHQKDMQQIMNENDKNLAMITFITKLGESGSNSYNKFIFLLEKLGLQEVVDEIHVELQAETRKLHVDSYAKREAEIFVNKFEDGAGLSLSEDARRYLIYVMAERFQIGKEATRRNFQRQMKTADTARRRMGQEIVILQKDIDSFLKEKAKVFNMPYDPADLYLDVEPSTFTGLGSVDTSVKAGIMNLQKRVEGVTAVLDQLIGEHEVVLEDRETCFKLLGVVDSKGQSLSQALQENLEDCNDEIHQSHVDLETTGQEMKNLKNKISDLRRECEKQVICKQNELDLSRKRLREKEKLIQNQEQMLENERNTQRMVNSELAFYKKRSEMLEKTRRLGYYYQEYLNRGPQGNPRQQWEEWLKKNQLEDELLGVDRVSVPLSKVKERGLNDSFNSTRSNGTNKSNTSQHPGKYTQQHSISSTHRSTIKSTGQSSDHPGGKDVTLRDVQQGQCNTTYRNGNTKQSISQSAMNCNSQSSLSSLKQVSSKPESHARQNNTHARQNNNRPDMIAQYTTRQAALKKNQTGIDINAVSMGHVGSKQTVATYSQARQTKAYGNSNGFGDAVDSGVHSNSALTNSGYSDDILTPSSLDNASYASVLSQHASQYQPPPPQAKTQWQPGQTFGKYRPVSEANVGKDSHILDEYDSARASSTAESTLLTFREEDFQTSNNVEDNLVN